MVTRKEKAARYQREWRRRNPDKAKNNELKKCYGITLEEYNEMLSEQQGVCAICGNPPYLVGTGGTTLPGSLAVDHCHKTGAVRGLLCTNCNLGLGSFFDNAVLLQRATAYLVAHEELLRRAVAYLEENPDAFK